MPSTVYSSDTYLSVAQRAIDYTQNGTLWTTVSDQVADDDIKFLKSTDGGTNWSEVPGMALSTVGSGVHSFFIDKDNYIHLIYIVSNERSYIRGTPDNLTAPTTYTWGSRMVLHTIGLYQGMEIVAHRHGTGWKAHMVSSSNDGSANAECHYLRVNIAADGTQTLDTDTVLVNYGANTDNNCSIDFRHDQNDPKAVQSSTPSVYVAYYQTSDNLRYKKIAYSAGVWTPGTERVIDVNNLWYNTGVPLYYDGTRIVMTHQRAGPDGVVRIDERDEADTATTNRNPTAISDGYVSILSVGYGSNQDIWCVAQGDTSFDIKKIRFNRGAGTWAGSWTVVEADSADSKGLYLQMMRGIVPGGSLGAAYRYQNSSPDQYHYDAVSSAWDGQATLQGVGSASAQGAVGYVGAASLQAVGSMSSTASLTLAGVASLQGVATLAPKALTTPTLDFTKYDGYLNSDSLGGPFGLIYHEDEQAKAQTVSRQLRPARSDVGNDPTEVRPETGEIFSQQDFSQGAGQLFFHHEGRDVKRYLWSEGFDADIDTAGEPSLLKHLRDVVGATVTFDWTPSSYIGKLEVFNNLLFVSSGQTVSRTSDVTTFWTSEDAMAAEGSSDVGVADLASSGEYLYAACGSRGIHRRDTTGAWSHWSDIPAVRVAWVKNRIVAASPTAIYEVISGGVVPTALETLPSGWTWTSIWEAAGFIYATAISPSSGLSRVHAYGLNSDLSALEKKSETPAPRDQLLMAGKGYLGTVYLGGGLKNSAGGYDPVLYQSVPGDDGSLSYAKVVEGEGAGSVDLSIQSMEPVGENMVFGYSLGSGFAYGARDGLGIHKLKNSAFLPWIKKNGAGAGRAVRGLTTFNGRLVFVLANDGVYYEDVTKYVLDAYLISSVADWQTTSQKAWDLFQVSSNPLPSGATVRLDYTTKLPSVGEWSNVIVESVAGDTLEEARTPELISRLLAVRIRSTAPAGQLTAPSGHGFLVRSNLLPDVPEFSLVRFVRLLNRDRKDEQGPEVFIDPQAIRETIQNLAYKWITLYEPGVIWTARVDQISEIQPFLEDYDQARGEWNRQAYIMQMVLSGTRD